MKRVYDKPFWIILFAVLILAVLYATTKLIMNDPWDLLDILVVGFAYCAVLFACAVKVKRSKATRAKIKKIYGSKE